MALQGRPARRPAMVGNRAPLLGWVLVLFVVALLLPTFAEIWRTWATHRYAGHGIFVPLLSALILWSRRNRLRRYSARKSGAGFAFVVGAVALAALGHAWQSVVAHVLAVVMATTALALWLRGSEWTKRAAAPIAFLGFMLPLPRELVALVTLPLQHFIAWLSSGFLDVLQVPVSRQGLLIDLASATLRVDESCNGLRFLMVLLIVTIAFALMHLPSRGRMLIVIAAALPVAVLANVVRVTAIGIAVTLVGPEGATGFYHDAIGRAVWILAVGSMLALGLFLAWSNRPARAALVVARAHPSLK